MRSERRQFFYPRRLAGIGMGLLLLAACHRLGAAESSALASLFRVASAEYQTLDDRSRALEAELQILPTAPANQQSGRLGFQIWRSIWQPQIPSVWVEVDLGKPQTLDAIVLVPVDAPYREFAGPGYGFPARFRIEVRGETDASAQIVAEQRADDFPNPGGLPVWVPVSAKAARFIRVTMTKPWRAPDGMEIFSLGEIMALRGNYNLIAGLPASAVTTSDTFESQLVWGKANLVDGQSLLGAPSLAEPSKVLGYHAAMADEADVRKWVQVDLGQSVAFEEVRLIGARVPQFPGRFGFGFPTRFKVEASDDEAFDQSLILTDETQRDFSNPASNPVTLSCHGTRARYVRMTATRLPERAQNFAFCLAELQVYSGGTNVALGKPVTALDQYPSVSGNWLPSHLTDGFSSESRLTEWPEWLQGLSRRREALHELASVQAKLASSGERLRHRFQHALVALGVSAFAGIGLGLLRMRRNRRNELEHLRQRIASDLHDDIGSNLGNIALLSEIVAEVSTGTIRDDVQEIHRIAQQTAESMRDIIWLIQRPAVTADDFVQRLRNIAARTLNGLEWNFTSEGLRELPSLDTQRHLVLAFKEVLHNVRKHACARRVQITLTQTAGNLTLDVGDDGIGFNPAAASGGNGLASLRHRGSKLGGEVRITTAHSQGTRLVLTAKL